MSLCNVAAFISTSSLGLVTDMGILGGHSCPQRPGIFLASTEDQDLLLDVIS